MNQDQIHYTIDIRISESVTNLFFLRFLAVLRRRCDLRRILFLLLLGITIRYCRLLLLFSILLLNFLFLTLLFGSSVFLILRRSAVELFLFVLRNTYSF